MADLVAFLHVPVAGSELLPKKKSSSLCSRNYNHLCVSTSPKRHGKLIKMEANSPQADHDQDFAVPVLSHNQVLERMKHNLRTDIVKEPFQAMYSSIYGGITTEPAFMVIPIDDHMVHRGHGVFDTTLVIDGYFYELDAHLDRLLRSAASAKINPTFVRSKLREILVKTAVSSECKQGYLRYWLSAGPGNFSLSSNGCISSAFYAIYTKCQLPVSKEGVRVVTSSVSMKPSYFSVMKNVNYLPNALSVMEAEGKGAFAGIWIDNDGFVAEGPNMNVAFVTAESELVMPAFDKILGGCTAKRLLDLAPKLVQQGLIKGVKVGKITVDEGKAAKEMMLIGSGVLVRPVVTWDETLIGNGKEGPVTLALLNLLLEDMKAGPPTVRVPVPYEIRKQKS